MVAEAHDLHRVQHQQTPNTTEVQLILIIKNLLLNFHVLI